MVTIGNATKEDIKRILAKISDGTFPLDFYPIDEYEKERMDSKDKEGFVKDMYGQTLEEAAQKGCLFVSKDKDNILCYSMTHQLGETEWSIPIVNVDSRHLKSGIGKDMVNTLVKDIERRGGTGVNVVLDNPGVKPFFVNLGFKPVSENRMRRELKPAGAKHMKRMP